jgi:cytochrome c biogenesis protein
MSVVTDRPAASPPSPPPRRPNRSLALLRNSWRQLTSMRTALLLLFLLAVAAIPGSVLPQKGVNIEKVNEFHAEHPKLAPVLERLGGFDVFASVWFSAIYLLLFTSLVGCIVPRLVDHLRALRSSPPAAPRRLDRLPHHTTLPGHSGDVAAIAEVLRRARWRVTVRGETVSAEKGYLKETGNLIFHFSMVVVLVGVAVGSWFGWHGNRLLVAGEDHYFCNTVQQYAESDLGPRVDSADLPPFCLELVDFEARFRENAQPEYYNATVRIDSDGREPRIEEFSVNAPLRLDGASVYLLGHGYAPIVRYTDRNGRSQTVTSPFLTIDGNLTGEGVAVFPDVNLDPVTGERDSSLQVAFEGLYFPTTPDEGVVNASAFPQERAPGLFLIPYRGNLGMDAGLPSSVYRLNQRQVTAGQLKQVGEGKVLRLGESWTLDDGTTVEFLGTKPYVTLSVRHDPGQKILLVGSVTLLGGLMLSLTGRRRRIFFRVTRTDPDGVSTTGGSSLVEVGGLPRTDYAGFAAEFDSLVTEVARVDARTGEGTV